MRLRNYTTTIIVVEATRARRVTYAAVVEKIARTSVTTNSC